MYPQAAYILPYISKDKYVYNDTEYQGHKISL